METYCQLQIAEDLNYITKENMEDIKLHVHKIANKLSALRRSLTLNIKH